jgi:hypothetical protein
LVRVKPDKGLALFFSTKKLIDKGGFMGLDMYLEKKTYLGFGAEMEPKTLTIKRKNGDTSKVDLGTVKSLVTQAAYWRKANHIHGWFVENVQDGEDNCEPYYVTRDKLKELIDLCEEVLAAKGTEKESEIARQKLPPTEGFFFGNYQINEWYWEDIEITIEQVKEALENAGDYDDFYYQSSW